MKVHDLKISVKYFDAVESCIKNAEVRYNDRDYGVGDWLVLREWDGKRYTGRCVLRRIMYIVDLAEIGCEKWVLLCMGSIAS